MSPQPNSKFLQAVEQIMTTLVKELDVKTNEVFAGLLLLGTPSCPPMGDSPEFLAHISRGFQALEAGGKNINQQKAVAFMTAVSTVFLDPNGDMWTQLKALQPDLNMMIMRQALQKIAGSLTQG